MYKNKAKEMWPIIKAFSEGKTIQIYIDGTVEGEGALKGWQDIESFDIDYFNQNDFFKQLPSFDYNTSFKMNGLLRIKPEPKLVPFTFEDNLIFRDKWVKYKGKNELSRFTNILKTGVKNDLGSATYLQLLNNYEFEDGSKCGKYINE